MYAHRPVEPEFLDLLVKEINHRLSKAQNTPLARVEEYNRGTTRWNWAFLWQSRLKVADVRMYADRRSVRVNFLYLGESRDFRNWVNLLHHANEPAWNEAIEFLSSLGQPEYWDIIMLELTQKITQVLETGNQLMPAVENPD